MSALAVPVDLRQLPLRALLAYAARCAHRVSPLFSKHLESPEAAICGQAIAAAITLCEDFAADRDVDPVLVASAEEATVRALMLAGESAGTDNVAAYAANAAYAAINATRVLLEACASDVPEEAAEAVVEAVGIARDAAISADERVAAAAQQDQEILRQLFLGRFPDLGDAIDPAESGLLGPLFPPSARPARIQTEHAVLDEILPQDSAEERETASESGTRVPEYDAHSPDVPVRQTGRAREKLRALVARIRKSRQALQRKRDSIERARRKLTELEAQLSERADQVQIGEAQFAERRRQAEQDAQEVAAHRLVLEQDLKLLEEERLELNRERAVLADEKMALAASLDGQALERQQAADLRVAVESTQAELQARHLDIESRQATLEKERAAFEAEQTRQSQLANDLQADQKRALETLREQAQQELAQKHDALEAAQSNLERQRAELSAALESLARQRETQKQQALDLDARDRQICQAEREFARVRTELDGLRADLEAEFSERAKQLQTRETELETRQSQSEQNTEELAATRGQVEQDLKRLKDERLELNRQLAAFEEEQARQSQLANDLQADQKQALETLREQAQKELSQKHAALAAAESALEQQRSDLEAARTELARQQAAQKRQALELDARKAKSGDQEQELKRAQSQLDELRSSLKSEQADLQAREAQLAARDEQHRAELKRFEAEQAQQVAAAEQTHSERLRSYQEMQESLAEQQAGLDARERDLTDRESRLQQQAEEIERNGERQSQSVAAAHDEELRAIDALRQEAKAEIAHERESLEQQRTDIKLREQALRASLEELAVERTLQVQETDRFKARCDEILAAEERVQSERLRLQELVTTIESQRSELASRESVLQTREAEHEQHLSRLAADHQQDRERRRAEEEQALHDLCAQAEADLARDRAGLDAEQREVEARREQLQTALQELSRQRETQKAETEQLEGQKQQIIDLNGRLREQEQQLQSHTNDLVAREEALQAHDHELRAAHERVRAEYELFQKERSAFIDEKSRWALEHSQGPEIASEPANTVSPVKSTTAAEPVQAAAPSGGNFAEQFLLVQEERRQLQIERAQMQQELARMRASRERGPAENQAAKPRTVTAKPQSRLEPAPLGLFVSPGSATSKHLAAFLAELQRLARFSGCAGLDVAMCGCRLETQPQAGREKDAGTGIIEFALTPSAATKEFSKHDMACWNQFQSCLRLLLSADNGVLSVFSSGSAAPARHALREFAAEAKRHFDEAHDPEPARSGATLPIDAMHQQRERIERLIVQMESQLNLQLGLAPIRASESTESSPTCETPRRGWKRWMLVASLAATAAAAAYCYLNGYLNGVPAFL